VTGRRVYPRCDGKAGIPLLVTGKQVYHCWSLGGGYTQGVGGVPGIPQGVGGVPGIPQGGVCAPRWVYLRVGYVHHGGYTMVYIAWYASLYPGGI